MGTPRKLSVDWPDMTKVDAARAAMETAVPVRDYGIGEPDRDAVDEFFMTLNLPKPGIWRMEYCAGYGVRDGGAGVTYFPKMDGWMLSVRWPCVDSRDPSGNTPIEVMTTQQLTLRDCRDWQGEIVLRCRSLWGGLCEHEWREFMSHGGWAEKPH